MGQPEDINDKNNVLLEHLNAQYRLYREEVRMYLGFAAASVAFFLAAIGAEISALSNQTLSKYPNLALLLPITALSYAALVGIMFVYIATAANYSSLLERKMNLILGERVFIYETYYVGPNERWAEWIPFLALCFCVVLMPVAVAGWGFNYLFTSPGVAHRLVWTVLVVFVVGLFSVLISIARSANLKRTMTEELLKDDKLTGVLRGRTIRAIEAEGNELRRIEFDDASAITVQGGEMPAEVPRAKIKAVRHEGTRLTLHFEDGKTLAIVTAKRAAGVMLSVKNSVME